MKKACLIVLLLLCGCAWAQADNIDSLKAELKKTAVDTAKVNLLLQLSGALWKTEPDTAIHYAGQANALAEQMGFTKGKALALKNIGLAYYIKGDYFNVLANWNSSLEVFKTMGDRVGEGNLLSNIGAVYFNQGDDAKAIEYYLAALKVSEETKDTLRMATALTNLGAAYFNNPATEDKAQNYYLQALPLSEAINDPDAIGTASVNLGEIYMHRGDYYAARFYFNKALAALKQTDGNVSYVLANYGKSYRLQGDYARAIKYLQDAYDIAKKIDAKLEMTIALNEMGNTFKDQNDFKTALTYYMRSKDMAQTIGSNNNLKDAYENLANCYEELGDYQSAFRYQKLFGAIKDTIYTIEKDKRIEGLQFQYEIEKKESEITLLNQENALKELQIQRANTLRNFLLAAAIFLLVTIGGITYLYLFAQKANKTITGERNRAEQLLLNILPVETAEELKRFGAVKARKYDFVTVLFTDFQAFSKHAETAPPEELVKSIDFYFKHFDTIFAKYNLEKIKTIGDSYMCAGGLPIENTTNPADAIMAGLEILEFIASLKASKPKDIAFFNIRIGISTGPVVAGVVGNTKFQYDIWGDTVNVASRMETACEVNKINISEFTYQHVKDQFEVESRGEVETKNRGAIKMYYVKGLKVKA